MGPAGPAAKGQENLGRHRTPADSGARGLVEIAPDLQGQDDGQEHDAHLQPAQRSSLAPFDVFQQAGVVVMLLRAWYTRAVSLPPK